jgi:hypothetical protein
VGTDWYAAVGVTRDDVARALAHEARQRRSDAVEHAAQVDVDHQVPSLAFERRVREPSKRSLPRLVRESLHELKGRGRWQLIL